MAIQGDTRERSAASHGRTPSVPYMDSMDSLIAHEAPSVGPRPERRNPKRPPAILWRVDADARRHVHTLAAERGVTTQALLDHLVLGRPLPAELPMTG